MEMTRAVQELWKVIGVATKKNSSVRKKNLKIVGSRSEKLKEAFRTRLCHIEIVSVLLWYVLPTLVYTTSLEVFLRKHFSRCCVFFVALRNSISNASYGWSLLFLHWVSLLSQ